MIIHIHYAIEKPVENIPTHRVTVKIETVATVPYLHIGTLPKLRSIDMRTISWFWIEEN